MMTAARIRTVVWVCVAAIAGVAGYLTGIRQGQAATIKALQVEAAGNLTQRVEALSRLRMGDHAAAISQLEGELDQLTLSIASNEFADRRVLAAAKAYRTVSPPSPALERALSAAFESVPDLKPDECSTALRDLLLSQRSDPADRE